MGGSNLNSVVNVRCLHLTRRLKAVVLRTEEAQSPTLHFRSAGYRALVCVLDMNARRKSGEFGNMQIGEPDTLTPRPRAPLINRYPPPKTALCGFFLFIIGLFFLCFGISVFYTHLMSHGQDKGIAMMVLGGLSTSSASLFAALFLTFNCSVFT
jgi:hypothetical protein